MSTPSLPGTVNGYPVIAAAALPDSEYLVKGRHIIVCRNDDPHKSVFPFVTWEIGHSGKDGHGDGQWNAYWGHHDLTRDEAFTDLAGRARWTDAHGNVLGMFFSSDNCPVEVGKRFWTNDLRVVTVTALGTRDQDYSDTGERQAWHRTTDGISDTLTGHMRQYGRLVRFYGGLDAERHPDGTNYGDVK